MEGRRTARLVLGASRASPYNASVKEASASRSSASTRSDQAVQASDAIKSQVERAKTSSGPTVVKKKVDEILKRMQSRTIALSYEKMASILKHRVSLAVNGLPLDCAPVHSSSLPQDGWHPRTKGSAASTSATAKTPPSTHYRSLRDTVVLLHGCLESEAAERYEQGFYDGCKRKRSNTEQGR